MLGEGHAAGWRASSAMQGCAAARHASRPMLGKVLHEHPTPIQVKKRVYLLSTVTVEFLRASLLRQVTWSALLPAGAPRSTPGTMGMDAKDFKS